MRIGRYVFHKFICNGSRYFFVEPKYQRSNKLEISISISITYLPTKLYKASETNKNSSILFTLRAGVFKPKFFAWSTTNSMYLPLHYYVYQPVCILLSQRPQNKYLGIWMCILYMKHLVDRIFLYYSQNTPSWLAEKRFNIHLCKRIGGVL